ncbi:hypothetical protein BDV34DRAFT_192051 [Aspergillus parasiticus]|uniref:Uncharacterized protein n=1 Tax=Aspergillus parasiticus TaxID=5067 RepID=A0A5N6DQ84_ASPPA|nr:hypothetical protein BDV34DRAFT_192051 [Aspergillus parasiticus]
MSSHPTHNELQPSGTTIPLELELEEDIDKEINHFVQLSRMGHYAEAQRFFDNTIGKHDYMFPIVAEYADMLLEQGSYRRAVELLNEHIRAKAEFLDPDEMQLLKIMKALAEIYLKGALRPALLEAKRAWSHLDLEGKQRLEDLNEVQIHIFEMYVNITVFGFRTSQWVDEGWMRCPLPQSTTQSENGFVQWFCVLREGGLLWEASRIMRALLPIMPSLPAGDLRELLDNSWSDGRSVELSVVERWAALMMALHQAHFLLNAALLVGILGDNVHAANQSYTMGWGRLEIAEQIWNTLPNEHKSGSSNLHLALEKVSFETARFCLSSRSADPDLLFALSNLLSEADRHNDLRNQTLVRLYILLCNDGAAMDWRDLYSILELQAADCGNVVEYVHIWDLFATWILNSELLFRHLLRNLPLESNRPTLLLSQHTSRPFSCQKWRNLIRKRSPFWEPLSLLGQSSSGSLTFDPSRYDYPLQFDIPLYSFSPDPFHQQSLRLTSEEYDASMHVVKTLIRHLNDMRIICLDEGEHNQVLYSEPQKQSGIKLQPNIRPRLSEEFVGDREAISAADKGRHNAASLAHPILGDKHDQPLLSVGSDKFSSDYPISTYLSKLSAASPKVSIFLHLLLPLPTWPIFAFIAAHSIPSQLSRADIKC